jgi:hypothetical protein
MSLLRREIPLLITLVFGGFILAEYFVIIGPSRVIAESILANVMVLTSFAVFVGTFNTLIRHGNVVIRRKGMETPRLLSAWVLLAFGITALFGFISPIGQNATYLWIYSNVQLPINTTLYGLLAMWITSAAYRALRARHLGPTLLLLSALAVILGNAPGLGPIIPAFESMRTWLLDYPTLGMNRALNIVFGIATILITLRTIIGKEKTAIIGAE